MRKRSVEYLGRREKAVVSLMKRVRTFNTWNPDPKITVRDENSEKAGRWGRRDSFPSSRVSDASVAN